RQRQHRHRKQQHRWYREEQQHRQRQRRRHREEQQRRFGRRPGHDRGPGPATGARQRRGPGDLGRGVTTLAGGSGPFGVFGTTATLLVSEPGRVADARAIADAELAAVDLACSRFRADSELSRLNAADGAPVSISPLLAELIGEALRAARLTAGDVDPTCGGALAALGYDRDFAELQTGGPGASAAPGPA